MNNAIEVDLGPSPAPSPTPAPNPAPKPAPVNDFAMDDVLKTVKLGLDLMKNLAKITGTQVDDKVVDYLSKIVDNEQLIYGLWELFKTFGGKVDKITVEDVVKAYNKTKGVK